MYQISAQTSQEGIECTKAKCLTVLMHTVIDSKVGIRQIPQWQTHKKSYNDIDSSESTLEMIFSHNLVGMQIVGTTVGSK